MAAQPEAKQNTTTEPTCPECLRLVERHRAKTEEAEKEWADTKKRGNKGRARLKWHQASNTAKDLVWHVSSVHLGLPYDSLTYRHQHGSGPGN